MEKQTKNQILTVPLLLLLALLVLLLAKLGFSYLNDQTVTINDYRINTVTVDNSVDRAKGLSAKNKLANNEGMLFIFDTPDYYCFWMKDMKFSIDMIWLNDQRKVVSIQENVLPESYPKSFCPTQPAKYVLEVQAGKSKEWQISLGNQANF